MDQIIIEKYYRLAGNEKSKIYDTDSIREEFETEISKLEKHNEKFGWSCFHCNFEGTEKQVEDHKCPVK